ncbi:hypothetical protein IW262DRAFT_1295408 [Armillaria fumosa]|nr:hypothetical protein IW262DRAFT_1295408 [Armillaria fumosa]
MNTRGGGGTKPRSGNNRYENQNKVKQKAQRNQSMYDGEARSRKQILKLSPPSSVDCLGARKGEGGVTLNTPAAGNYKLSDRHLQRPSVVTVLSIFRDATRLKWDVNRFKFVCANLTGISLLSYPTNTIRIKNPARSTHANGEGITFAGLLSQRQITPESTEYQELLNQAVDKVMVGIRIQLVMNKKLFTCNSFLFLVNESTSKISGVTILAPTVDVENVNQQDIKKSVKRTKNLIVNLLPRCKS